MINEIPINGRIAIIDDREKEIAPLMRLLSKHSLPYIYVNPSDDRFFPEVLGNDIRLLFLDLNLLGSQALQDKQVKGMLAGVLKRIVSPNNFPYIIILWSNQESEYKNVLMDLFQNELKDIAPIACKSFIKSEFFPVIDGDEVDSKRDLLAELANILNEVPVYRFLLFWENLIHESADGVLDEVFNNENIRQDWPRNASCLFTSLGRAYVGKHFEEGSIEDRVKWAYPVLNSLLEDTIESGLWKNKQVIGSCIFENVDQELSLDEKARLNKKLLTSPENNGICDPGSVLKIVAEEDTLFRAILNNLLSILKIKTELKKESPDILDSLLKKQASKKMSEIKKEIQGSWIKIGLVVTPSCDFAQKKKVFDRVVFGILIKSSFRDYINEGQSFFISPVFEFNSDSYVLALDYKYLTTVDLEGWKGLSDGGFLFKIRRQMLVEVQAQLSRHISRPGMLFLD